jgi:hypothetical protein
VGERGGQVIDIRPYLDVAGVYDSGLIGVTLNQQGLPPIGAEGVVVGFGVLGTRRWKHDILAVDYRGTYTRFVPQSTFDGVSQFLTLSYTHLFNARETFTVRETGGVVPFSYGALTFVPLQNSDLIGVPVNQVFDVPVYFSQTSADFTYAFTPRLSMDIGGDGFFITYGAVGLTGVTGGVGRGSLSYRLTRRQTVSLAYGYTAFQYTNAFGNAKFQSVALGWSLTLGKRWELGLQAGGYRISSLQLTEIPVNPTIASIIGQGYATVVANPVQYAPLIQAGLTRRFQRSSLSFAYGKTIMPGNGIYLASKAQTASGTYSYLGHRRFSASVTAGYSDLSAVSQTIGTFRMENFGTGATYKLRDNVFLELRYDYLHYNTGIAGYLTNEQRVSLGFAFSPGATPLAIW